MNKKAINLYTKYGFEIATNSEKEYQMKKILKGR